MPKLRQNEKKYHSELVDLVNDDLGGYGYKAQRGFVKGVPDVELKVPHLPLVKIEVKHEVWVRMPTLIKINLTKLQRIRLKHMQKANLSCGWAVFITVDKKTLVAYGTDPDAEDYILDLDSTGHRCIAQPFNNHLVGITEWIKHSKIAALSQILNLLTRLQLYSQKEEPSTGSSATTPKLLKI